MDNNNTSEKKLDVEELIQKGKSGSLSSNDIDIAIEEMNYDMESLNQLYETLEDNGIPLPGEVDTRDIDEIESEGMELNVKW